MLDRGTSSKAAPALAAGAAETEPDFLTSSSVILPPGPDPLTPTRETPLSLARRRAAGVALGERSRALSILPSLEYCSGSGAGSGADLDPELSDFDSSLDSFLAGAEDSPPASERLKDSKAAISVPSSTRTAMGCMGYA